VKRPLAVLTIPLAVLGFVACSDDDDDGTDTTTASSVADTEPDVTTATSDTTSDTTSETTGESSGGVTLPGGITIPSLPDISLPDTLPGGITLPSLPSISLPSTSELQQQIIDTFTQMGMTEEQAQCLVDRIDLSSGQIPDLSSIMNLFNECDINLGDLNPDG
jgi:hypothetical protein